MGLILRQTITPNSGTGLTIKGSTLTYAEADGNFTYLMTNMSGSRVSITGPTSVTGSLTVSGGITGSFSGSLTGLLVGTSSWATNALTASSADSFTVRGTLTATTIVAQTITASTEWVTGSSKFGSIITNTHQFTGSVSISGSLTPTSLTTGEINSLSASTIRQDGDSSGTTGTLNILSNQSTYGGSYDASVYIGGKWQSLIDSGEALGYRLFVSNSGAANSTFNIQTGIHTVNSNILPSTYNNIVIITTAGTTITGSLTTTGNTKLGNAITDTHIITGSLSTSGSVTINNILTLTARSTTPASQPTGSIICSGSGVDNHLYYYNGTSWRQLDN